MADAFENESSLIRSESTTNLSAEDEEVNEPYTHRISQLYKIRKTFALIDKNTTGVRNTKSKKIKI